MTTETVRSYTCVGVEPYTDGSQRMYLHVPADYPVMVGATYEIRHVATCTWTRLPDSPDILRPVQFRVGCNGNVATAVHPIHPDNCEACGKPVCIAGLPWCQCVGEECHGDDEAKRHGHRCVKDKLAELRQQLLADSPPQKASAPQCSGLCQGDQQMGNWLPDAACPVHGMVATLLR